MPEKREMRDHFPAKKIQPIKAVERAQRHADALAETKRKISEDLLFDSGPMLPD